MAGAVVNTASAMGWEAQLRFLLLGIVVVFAALAFLWMALEMLSWMFRRFYGPLRDRTLAVMAGGSFSPEMVAVIGAAIHTVLSQPFHVVGIQESPYVELDVERRLQAWSLEGRREIFLSHRLR